MTTKITSNVSLKNLKLSEFASHETSCFEATIYIDGRRAGTTGNDGNGGPNWYEPAGLGSQLEAIAASLPPVDMAEYGLPPMEQSADLLVGNLIEQVIVRRKVARLIATKTYIRKPGEQYKPGEWLVFKGKTDPVRIKTMQDRFGEDVLILGQNYHDVA